VPKPNLPEKRYLGDAVYADISHDSILLTTEDGINVTNSIVLERDVYEALVKYAKFVAGWPI
jgi:hypothetical protein